MNPSQMPTIFVWHGVTDEETAREYGFDPLKFPRCCPFCGIELAERDKPYHEVMGSIHALKLCSLCGFWYEVFELARFFDVTPPFAYVSTLRSFSINDKELGLREVGTYLRSHLSME